MLERQEGVLARALFASTKSGVKPVGKDLSAVPSPVYCSTHICPLREQSFPEKAIHVYLLFTVFESSPATRNPSLVSIIAPSVSSEIAPERYAVLFCGIAVVLSIAPAPAVVSAFRITTSGVKPIPLILFTPPLPT